MSTRLSGQFLTVSVPYELGLKEGPEGELLRVVDFDPVRKSWYAMVDLDEPYVLAQDGLQPAEGDPRSHQQIVYAVASSVIERFERYLGRRFRWRGDEKLSLVPHAFEGRNAFFDPTRKAVLFGYYRADLKDPGANLPGQMIFTCLSSDIIAHEVTHAIVHRLRTHFSEATNPDVFAWHEAFADLIALFQHFAYEEVVVRRDRVDVGKYPTRCRPIRSGIGIRAVHRARRGVAPGDRSEHAHADSCARPTDTARPPNPMNAARVSSVRCSTPTSIGIKPPSPTSCDWRPAAQPDSPAADCIPTWWPESPPKPSGPQTDSSGMVVRAFDYLPPVDVTFGDVVRAIVTSDHSLYPTDRLGLRGNLIEALRRRGIYPTASISLTDRALIWPRTRRASVSVATAIRLCRLRNWSSRHR